MGPHIFLFARARYFFVCARAVFFCLRALGGGGPIFVCAWRGGGVVDNSAHLGHFFGCVPTSCLFVCKINDPTNRNDHTTVTAPLPVCSAKLSTVGPG